jgi:hypothetical protein
MVKNYPQYALPDAPSNDGNALEALTGRLGQLDSDSIDKIDKQAEKLDETVSDELESKEPGLDYAQGGTAFTNFWNTANEIRRRYGDYARGGNVSQQLADRYLRQNIGGSGIHPAEGMHDYDEAPTNSPSNDPHSSYVKGHPGDQLPLKSRKGSEGTGFARGGSTVNKNPYATPLPDGHGLPPSVSTRFRAKPRVTAAWETKQRIGKGMHIAAPHSGEGLVLNVHLGNVAPHALSLTDSGGVNVARMAGRASQSDARPTNPF